MYELPYFSISKETLIPHPGVDYTLSLPLQNDFATKNLTIEEIEYKNLFILYLSDVKTTICSLCLLQNISYSQEEQIIYFTSINKVNLKRKKRKTCFVSFFDEKPLSKINDSYLNNLLTFIKQSKNLQFISNFITSVTDSEIIISTIATLLYLTPEADARIYSLIDFKSRINIIYDGLISTIIMQSNNLDKAGEFNTQYPESVLIKINQEEDRLKNIAPSSPEYSATLDYLDTINSIPWNKYSNFDSDIILAETTLNNLHYGLQSVKEDFLDFLYLEKLTNVKASSCFLFDGPPGVGKTSLAKTIAKALKRDFIFISLAGISDESEIRGHRRTYAGSKPGRIISNLKNCSFMNPVILLDEIDKIAQTNGIKPVESSLLELFDSEQRAAFMDRYLEVPIDLSKAIFICTSNSTKSISKPLLDRLQIVNFEDYTKFEKIKIIQDYIFPKYINDYNLNSFNLSLALPVQTLLASNYSLRDAKNLLARCLRRKSKCFLSSQKTSNIIDEDFIAPFLTTQTKARRIGFC
jgi:SpoVK/Ycf46/Vps4 family AAA+-type ATPase